MEPFLESLPKWILVIIALMWAVDKFLLPLFAQYRDKQKSDMDIKTVKAELDQLRRELEEWESRYATLNVSYQQLQQKYNGIIGMLRGFQVYLRDKGMADFPLMDELVKHANEK